MTAQRIHTTVFNFNGASAVIPATGSNGSPMVKKITAAGGAPTVSVSSGAATLAMDNTNEVQNLCLYQDDNLGFDIDDIKQVRIWASVSSAIGSSSKWRFGLSAARNDDPDAITASVFFGADGNTTINAECDDGTNEVAAASTGLTISSTPKKFVIDFSKGKYAQNPPNLSYGGKYAVELFAEDSNGLLKRVLSSTRFNMGAHSTGLQVLAQLQKTLSTNTGTLKIHRIEVDHVVLD
jgi:hypothetical protein